ncbi:MAG: VCBS repeat-containing protein [bacterium]|nr:VCBS repeat-containing protein [bacterium]
MESREKLPHRNQQHGHASLPTGGGDYDRQASPHANQIRHFPSRRKLLSAGSEFSREEAQLPNYQLPIGDCYMVVAGQPFFACRYICRVDPPPEIAYTRCMQKSCLALILGLTACSLGHPLTGIFPRDEDESDSDLSALLLLGFAGQFAGLTVQASVSQVLIYENVTFTVAGGTPPYSFRVSRGGGTITISGVFTAGPVLGANTVTVVDSTGLTGSASVNVSGGAGDGTFQTSLNYAAFDAPQTIQSGDFTNDGVLDLLVGTSNAGAQEMRIYAGNGDGSFQTGTSNPIGAGIRSVTVGDFNADGNLDMAGGTTGNRFSVFLGNSDITFQPRVDYPHTPGALGIRAGDMDGDGVQDIVSGDFNDGTISFWKGSGDGTFQSASTFGSLNAPRFVELADLNNDGALDIAAPNLAGAPSTNPGATVFPGNGDGTFGAGVENDSPAGGGRFVIFGDFNGDSNLDLVTLPASGSDITIFNGNGDGSFQTGQVYTVTGATVDRFGVACDFNSDGRLDLALADRANSAVAILFGDGAGSFTVGPQLAAPTNPHGVHCRDLNRDGIMDIAAASFNTDTLRVFLGN